MIGEAKQLLRQVGLTASQLLRIENYRPLVDDLNKFALNQLASIVKDARTFYDASAAVTYLDERYATNPEYVIVSLAHELKHAVGNVALGISSYDGPENYAKAELRNEAEAQLAEYRAFKAIH